MITRLIPLVLLAFGLAACASLSEDECRAQNWYALGVEDGAKGADPNRLITHARACDEYNILPDRESYTQGRIEGLKQYCRPRNAYQLGKNGVKLKPYCPSQIAPRLSRLNRVGLNWYEIGQEIDRLDREAQRVRAEYRGVANSENGRILIRQLRSEYRQIGRDIRRLRLERLRYQL